jgi:hypothetical protein
MYIASLAINKNREQECKLLMPTACNYHMNLSLQVLRKECWLVSKWMAVKSNNWFENEVAWRIKLHRNVILIYS